ncbi:MAG: hypothetical protein CMM54_10735 [Rhodospirillaceae bacterium]|nr:hypothetical protein [Rhodospirillaceae bacterium]
MTRVLLIIPPSPDNRHIARFSFQSYESKGNYHLQPKELMAITGCLAEKDEVTFIDGTCDKQSEAEFLSKIDRLDGDIVFFSMSNTVWKSDYRYLHEVKSRLADIPIYVQGDIFLDKDAREFILSECDGVVFYPYMLEVAEMAGARQNGGGPYPGVYTASDQTFFGHHSNRLHHISSGIPRHDIFLKSGYRFPFAKHKKFATVVTTYGCPFVCSYCGSANLPPGIRPTGSILEELRHIEALGVKELWFYDSTFGFYKKETVPLLEEMARRHNFSWSTFTNHQICTPDFLKLMNDAGCHTVILGVDSASEKNLKTFRRNSTLTKLELAIATANDLKMNICADFILGLENETRSDVEKTISYALKLPIDYASFNVIVPTPGTSVSEKLKQQGASIFDLVNFDSLGKAGNIGNKHLSGDEIIALRNRAVKKFYLRPRHLARRLMKTTSFEHFQIQFEEMAAIVGKVR